MNIVLLKDTAKVQDESLILKAVASHMLEKYSWKKESNISMFIRLNPSHYVRRCGKQPCMQQCGGTGSEAGV